MASVHSYGAEVLAKTRLLQSVFFWTLGPSRQGHPSTSSGNVSGEFWSRLSILLTMRRDQVSTAIQTFEVHVESMSSDEITP
jgi:hypothetical protein